MEKLTPQEEEVMRIMWQQKGAFVREVLEQLEPPQPPYTTLASLVKNIERKGYLQSTKVGNSLRYTPTVSAKEYNRGKIGSVVKNYFSNSYQELVTFFINDQKLSPEELEEVLRIIKEGKK